MAIALLTSCSFFDEPGSDCAPDCGGRACGDDGCGGSCGQCLAGSSCVDGLCIVDAGAACDKTCAELGYLCGEHCGMLCGTCPYEGAVCVDHRCECTPACAGRECGQGDGCGGICGDCPSASSCSACELRLSVLTDRLVGGARIATLALDYQPTSGQPRPGLVDLRLEILGSVAIEQVGLATALVQSGKELFVHPYTGQPFQQLRQGVFRFLISSPRNNDRFPAGRWMFLKLRAVDDPAAPHRPIQVRLLREAPVFAPMASDQAVSLASFSGAVILPLEVADAE